MTRFEQRRVRVLFTSLGAPVGRPRTERDPALDIPSRHRAFAQPHPQSVAGLFLPGLRNKNDRPAVGGSRGCPSLPARPSDAPRPTHLTGVHRLLRPGAFDRGTGKRRSGPLRSGQRSCRQLPYTAPARNARPVIQTVGVLRGGWVFAAEVVPL